MSILVSGSLVYDHIMNFPDSFKNHILPDQIHILNVCFVVDELRKNFGGCAGNIAYTVKLLGGDPIILAALGMDAIDYLEHFKKKPRSPYEVKAGSYIPAALITGINSDLPGSVNAQVTENVYDTVTGNFLLIPQGAKLVGEYNSHLTFGQQEYLKLDRHKACLAHVKHLYSLHKVSSIF